MINNASMPSSAIIPELAYSDVAKAVDWLTAAFGFRERMRIADHRAQLSFGSGHLIVIQGPEATDVTHKVMVRVADVDAHHAQSKQCGARILREPETLAHGERQYSATDLGGHVWVFSQSVADVDPSSWGGVICGIVLSQNVQVEPAS